MFVLTNAATTFGRPEVTVDRGRERGRTVKCTASDDDTCLRPWQYRSLIDSHVSSSEAVGGMNAARFDNFLAQARTNLDPDEG